MKRRLIKEIDDRVKVMIHVLLFASAFFGMVVLPSLFIR